MTTPERPRRLVFGPFRIDRKDERLWRGKNEVPLGRKAFGVLCELADHAGELVTKDELLAAVWPRTAVTEAVLTTAVRELRRSLGDRARRARFIETVHGRGYRFVATVATSSATAIPPVTPAPPAVLVGREAERARLRDALGAVRDGERRVVLVAGEPGIGKTALVDAFLSADAAGEATIARGQCIEAYGAGEPYLPLLDALARLGREGQSAEIAHLFAAHAPSWLPHLPSLTAEPRPGVQPTAMQMLRELADAMDVLARDRTFVLVIEDLHWCDTATLAWMDAVARRRDAARLLLVATYRPVQAIVRGGPLRRLLGELRRLSAVSEIVLDYLTPEAVATYARAHLPGRASDNLARVLHERSHGLPLFLVTLVEELRRAGPSTRDAPDLAAVATRVPASVRQHIERQIDALAPDERRLLEAASIAGPSFSAAAVGAAAGLPESEVDDTCVAWARDGRFVREAGAERWPDGTLTTAYRFRHDLWPEVLRQRLPAGRKARLHREIACRLERAYGNRTTEIAGELAAHFEEGCEIERALRHRRAAAGNAVRRSACSEALFHVERGLSLLTGLGPGAPRDGEELALTLDLGAARAASEGWAAPGLDEVYARARALARGLGDAERELRAIWGELAVAFVRADYASARQRSRELGDLAERCGDRSFRMAARFELAGIDLLLGAFGPARAAMEEALALYDPADHGDHVERFGVDLGVFALAWSAQPLWLVGETARALARSAEAVERSGALDHPFTRAVALAYATMLARLAGDAARARDLAASTADVCERYGFPYYGAWARIFGGSPSGRDRVADIRAGIGILEASGGQRSRAYHEMLLAEALLEAGDSDAAARALDDAFAALARTGERWCESELLRVQGEIRAARGDAGADPSFRRALELAGDQGAHALALRAALAFARVSEAGRDRLAVLLREAPPELGGPEVAEARSRLAAAPR